MESSREQVRAWLEDVLRQTGETPSALARRAGLATTTLTRFLTEEGEQRMLGLRSIAKIAHAANVAPLGVPGVKSTAGPVPGFAEQEAAPYRLKPEQPSALDQAVTALIGGRSAADPWVLKSRALELAGYLPGDILILDLNAVPERQKVVCAQVYRWEERRAETVFRIYEPPYLVAASNDPAFRKPLLVDNDRVIIKGVVTHSLRVPG